MDKPKSFEELHDWIADQTTIGVQIVLLMNPNGSWMPRKGVILPNSIQSTDEYDIVYGVTLDDTGNLIAIQAAMIPESVIQNTPHTICNSLKNISVYELKDTRNVMPWAEDRLPWGNYTIERMMASVLNIRIMPLD